jgi:hypothetical protein
LPARTHDGLPRVAGAELLHEAAAADDERAGKGRDDRRQRVERHVEVRRGRAAGGHGRRRAGGQRRRRRALAARQLGVRRLDARQRVLLHDAEKVGVRADAVRRLANGRRRHAVEAARHGGAQPRKHGRQHVGALRLDVPVPLKQRGHAREEAQPQRQRQAAAPPESQLRQPLRARRRGG